MGATCLGFLAHIIRLSREELIIYFLGGSSVADAVLIAKRARVLKSAEEAKARREARDLREAENQFRQRRMKAEDVYSKLQHRTRQLDGKIGLDWLLDAGIMPGTVLKAREYDSGRTGESALRGFLIGRATSELHGRDALLDQFGVKSLERKRFVPLKGSAISLGGHPSSWEALFSSLEGSDRLSSSQGVPLRFRFSNPLGGHGVASGRLILSANKDHLVFVDKDTEPGPRGDAIAIFRGILLDQIHRRRFAAEYLALPKAQGLGREDFVAFAMEMLDLIPEHYWGTRHEEKIYDFFFPLLGGRAPQEHPMELKLLSVNTLNEAKLSLVLRRCGDCGQPVSVRKPKITGGKWPLPPSTTGPKARRRALNSILSSAHSEGDCSTED